PRGMGKTEGGSPGVNTVISFGPSGTPAGTSRVIVSAVAMNPRGLSSGSCGNTDTPPITTSLAPKKFDPLMVIRVPTGPAASWLNCRIALLGAGAARTVNTPRSTPVLVALPPGVITVIGPVVAPNGTRTDSSNSETTTISGEGTPLNRPALAPSRLVPVIPIVCPSKPPGVKLVIAGAAEAVTVNGTGLVPVPP